jgi:hypothetical protein
MEAAEAHFERFVAVGAQENRVRQLDLMLRCANGTVASEEWATVAREAPATALDAAYSLMPSGAHSACAKEGFRAVMASDSAERLLRMDGVLGLQSMLLAEGKPASVKTVLGAAIDFGISYAYGYYVIDAIAGGETRQEAIDFLTRLGSDLEARSPQTLWLMGEWAAFNEDLETLEKIVPLLEHAARNQERIARESGDVSDNLARRRRLFADAMAAHRAALRGEREEALAILSDLRPTATRPNIAWSLWESLGFERLLEARLLLDEGRYEEAMAVATELDHPAPVVYRALSNRSLELRARVADAQGDPSLAARYRAKLPETTQEGGTP